MRTVTLRVRSVVWFATGIVVALVAAAVFVQASRTDAGPPWPGQIDSTFVPATPCRLADTRPGENHVGPNDTLRTDDTTTMAAHGANGLCTIPDHAVALALNVTALGATELTFLTFWPDGPRPLAASLNPAPGEPPTPNAVNVPLSGAGSFNIYNSVGSVNIVIDVTGYYTNLTLTDLDSWATYQAHSAPYVRVAGVSVGAPRIVREWGVESVDRVAVGIYTVEFSRDVHDCAWLATLNDPNRTYTAPPGEISVEPYTSTSSLQVRTFDSGGVPNDLDPDEGFSLYAACY